MEISIFLACFLDLLGWSSRLRMHPQGRDSVLLLFGSKSILLDRSITESMS